MTLEWEAGPMGDMLADAITAVVLQVILCLLGLCIERQILEQSLKPQHTGVVS